MDWIIPKKRGLYAAIFCIAIAIISYFFNLGPVWSVSLLLQAVAFFVIHLVMQNIEIRLADIFFYILTAISLYLTMFCFGNTNFAFNIGVEFIDNKINKYAIKNCQEGCTIGGNAIYNNQKEKVYGWHGIAPVYNGYIEIEKNQIKYQISFEEKCVTKNFNTKYVIIDNKCEK